VGDRVFFGTFEQDGSTSNGREPIEWIVMGVFDDYIDLISLEILDVVPYHKANTPVDYLHSDVNEYLNMEFLL
jgi:hypothetical protein